MLFKSIGSEFSQYLKFVLTGLPGKSGIILRYRYYKRHMGSIGKNVLISQGCMIRGEKNIRLGDSVGLGIDNKLYAGISEGEESIEI